MQKGEVQGAMLWIHFRTNLLAPCQPELPDRTKLREELAHLLFEETKRDVAKVHYGGDERLVILLAGILLLDPALCRL